MEKKILKKILAVKEQMGSTSPFLLGLSGGPDSLFLFHMLLLAKVPFCAAHFDHGWRPESKKQAEALSLFCNSHGIELHLKEYKTCFSDRSNNLEEKARNDRLSFFSDLIEEKKLSALILAHHADDQAHTVLKRVLEGASLPKLKGLSTFSNVRGIKICRPLLGITKKEIYDWLRAKEIPYFIDSTNENVDYLRNRMRIQILPYLSEIFGKKIEQSLCRVGRNAKELEDLLEELLQPYKEKIDRRDGRIILDLSEIAPKNRFLLKTLLKHFFLKAELSLSDPLCEMLVFHFEKKSRHKEFRVGKKRVYLHKGWLSISEVNDFA